MWTIVRRKPLLFILLGAFALRASAGVALQHHLDGLPGRHFLIEGDANGYWDLGEKIAAGRDYAIYEPPRRILRMPGFPAMLALAIKTSQWFGIGGQSYLVARLMLAIVGTLACGLVALLGTELFDRRIGLISAAITAVLPTMVVFSVVLLSETLFAACLVASLLVMAKFYKTQTAEGRTVEAIIWSALVGMTIALASYVRPTWLAAAPAFVVFCVVTSRRKKAAMLHGAIVLFTLALMLFPWAARNHQVSGHWVVTSLWAGPSLYDGLNPDATGDSNMQFFNDDDVMGEGMSEYEMNRHYTHKAIKYAVEHPRRTAELSLLKLWRFWKPWPNAAQFDTWPARLAIACSFVPLMVLAAFGCWTHRLNALRCLLTAGPALGFCIVHMVFVSSLRYRLPVEYPLYILASAGFVGWFGKENS